MGVFQFCHRISSEHFTEQNKSAQEELCQVLLVVPDCVKLGREPESKAGVENMQLLLLLLLGCAVQCPNKETFIDRIKQLDVQVQHAIVDCIRQVSLSYLVYYSDSALIEFILFFSEVAIKLKFATVTSLSYCKSLVLKHLCC